MRVETVHDPQHAPSVGPERQITCAVWYYVPGEEAESAVARM